MIAAAMPTRLSWVWLRGMEAMPLHGWDYTMACHEMFPALHPLAVTVAGVQAI